ncbi:capsular polysaccharide biosynthesis protein [Tropicimonas isoalkanivorans]|uniref:Capsular polysaccharide export protein n=1 Tax=Tropicimonas isoalkanivorans TaxID=441112 RepID=A0A1I1K9U9_9RHOB|nr:capsular polysaccharide biosynthesis protein [Tropicimonas isoalkanivorans]SFC55478.1 capsular polysaccharide export protein [Tropicimonas isoalkanivorans]
MTPGSDDPAAEQLPRRLFVYDAGFLAPSLRRILRLSGWQVTTGRPGPDDWVGVWGRSPTARRGEAMADRMGAKLMRVEDAFLRSVRTGRRGAAPMGLLLDESGVHFDSGQPSDLELLLAGAPLDDTPLLNRARAGIDRLRRAHLSQYNALDPELEPPAPGYVLVIDQPRGDASIAHGGASEVTFAEMLTDARLDNPGARILVKSHPETAAGRRSGHYDPAALPEGVEACTAPLSPWHLLEGAIAVYTVSSQMGFEAIFAGHRPHVYGQPYYAGWGLTEDREPPARRGRHLTRAQLFAAAMILYPIWYDPYRDRLCSFEEALDGQEARVRAFREDRAGYVATGIRLRKRRALKGMFGREQRLRFVASPHRAARGARVSGRPLLAWASAVTPEVATSVAKASVPLIRVEDGFLRSRGLGAALVPPLSFVTDDLGIHYDPSAESRLEHLIAASESLPESEIRRAERLMARLISSGVTKYNVGTSTLPPLTDGPRVLVAGQVEDDASVRLGCGDINSNLGLLRAAREANPDCVILYKPHPDVEAGLRPGAIEPEQMDALADMVMEGADPAALIDVVEEVWTLTSLLGFEALIRGRAVTCLGAPFYAGWGLTRDLGPVPARRMARPPLAALVHAALIAYPRYRDPVSGLPCPVEVVLDHLEHIPASHGGPVNRTLSKVQGLLASRLPVWR